MTEVPKIVYDRLRAVRPLASPHPDADLLTAFAEQALSTSERGDVLEHLAICENCRELIALALPAVDPVAVPVADDAADVRVTVSREPALAPRKFSFAWPRLRWAAMAAGVALAAVMLLVRPGKLNQLTLPFSSPQIATTATPASTPQIASSPAPSSPAPSPAMGSPATDRSASLGTYATLTESGMGPSKKRKAARAVTPSQAESGMLLAYNTKNSVQAGKMPAAPSPGAQAFDYGARTSQSVTESVNVARASESVVVEPSTEGTQMARNDAPAIEKAKPALHEQEIAAQKIAANERQKTEPSVASSLAKSAPGNLMSATQPAPSASQTLAQHLTWKIMAGVLQRSLDGGQSWQSAVRADHLLLCYANHGADVWTGGQAGTLLHSGDSGVTWLQVQASSKGRTLTSDITRIDIRDNARGLAAIVVSTNHDELWSSVDNGKTWEEK